MDSKRTSEKKKIRVICTRTGTKFNHWWEDNLKFMVDKYSALEYDEFVVIKDEIFEDDYGTFNNLIMFNRYTEKDWVKIESFNVKHPVIVFSSTIYFRDNNQLIKAIQNNYI